MIHIVVPEGLNRPSAPGIALSDYYAECLRQVGLRAAPSDTVYLAPGNSFGHPAPEDHLAAQYLRLLHPKLQILTIEVSRTRYLDTLDNAVCLRDWILAQGGWPLETCTLYCTRFHRLRAWLCFRVAGFRLQRIVATAPLHHTGEIAPRLKYYDFPPAHIAYEVLAIAYTALRLFKNVLTTGHSLPGLEHSA